MTEPRPWIQDAFKEATDEQLFAELRRRGFGIVPHEGDAINRPHVQVSSERNSEPEEKWLAVWSHLNQHQPGDRSSTAQADLHLAIQKLYLLLEPPSVRERRTSGGD